MEQEKNSKKQQEDGAVKMNFTTVLEAILVFMNSYMLMHRLNKLCFIAMNSQESKLLAPAGAGGAAAGAAAAAAGPAGLRAFRAEVLAALRRTDRALREAELARLQRRGQGGAAAAAAAGAGAAAAGAAGAAADNRRSGGSIKIAQALSKALCYANRVKSTPGNENIQVRALVVAGSAGPPSQYSAAMNATFGAQRMGAIIDALALSSQPSVLLQQATYLTGGIYQQLDDHSNLLQYLLTFYLSSPYTRRMMKLPKQEEVDFRSTCFCHQRPVEIAYVCSVCVSVFCKFSPECSTCGTRAKPKRLKREEGACDDAA